MRGDEIRLLGIGIQPPWQLVDQHLDTTTRPHELHLRVQAERGARYACPVCSQLCPAHDYTEKRWRHLNFFQHHCYITAAVPRVPALSHGVARYCRRRISRRARVTELRMTPLARLRKASSMMLAERMAVGMRGTSPVFSHSITTGTASATERVARKAKTVEKNSSGRSSFVN